MSEKRALGIILAAGKGVRMKSDLPKALQKVGGVPMIRLIIDAMKGAGIERVIVVIGHQGEIIQEHLGSDVEYAWQKEQLGTGHAVRSTSELLKGYEGSVVVASGDTPLLDEELFRFILENHAGASCTMPTAIVSNPFGYGRILRNEKGDPIRIVEQKDATPEQREIHEINPAIYCFEAPALLEALPSLSNSNAQKEYLLTDLVEIFAKKGLVVKAIPYETPEILEGVNDKWQLALAERSFQKRILKKHAIGGVSILDIDSTYIGPYVQIGAGSVIEPGTVVLGKTEIGTGVTLGPNTRIEDCTIGANCRIYMSHLQEAQIGNNVKCGPFANIRPGTVMEDGVKIGNYVEVKNSTLKQNVSASHLSYIGDAEVGERTNVGAGTITCNFDGFSKSRTTIGKDVFVGSHSTLVAPLTIEDGALIAAGSTITSDVPEGAGAFGRARQETKPGWATKWREMRRKQK